MALCPAPPSSLVPHVGETGEKHSKMSQERNATGSLRTWALCPAGLRPQQCRHCPSQEGWNVDEGQLDPSATQHTKGLRMGQEEGWEMGLWERGRQCALTELFKALDAPQLQACQIPKGASNARLIPSRQSWFRGSTKKKIDPVTIRFPGRGRCFIHWPHLVPRAPVSHFNHYPFTYSLVCCKSSTDTSYYYCCCHHSYDKWREDGSWHQNHLSMIIELWVTVLGLKPNCLSLKHMHLASRPVASVAY